MMRRQVGISSVVRAVGAGWLVLAGLVGLGCGPGSDGDDTVTITAALVSSQDVLGFEVLDAWTPSSGSEALTTTHTQGASAYALTAPVNFTNIVGAPIDSAAPSLQGISATGSGLALDMVIPTQQPNPSFIGSVQLLVNAPSRGLFNRFLGQVELTGLPRGSFQTLRFPVSDSVRTALRNATFSDLTFTVALNAPSGATGTYVFDNLRVTATNNAEFKLTPTPAVVTAAQGATAQSTVAIARTSFASSVSFAASGLPAGVTASFSPASTTGTSSVVTFTAAATAAIGTATVMITGTGGGLARTATIGLTVSPGPTFTLAATPATVAVVPGATAGSTIAVSRQNGFTAAVAFGASGLPAGVTATFAPASTTGNTSTVTFAATADAAPASTTVTITGTGGGLTRITSVALTVTAPPGDFALSSAAASLAVTQGGAVSADVAVLRIDGFPSTISFAASGLPTGVTASFAPASTSGDLTTLTLTALATAAVGPVTVTITGTGGGLTRTTTLALLVNEAVAGDFAISASPVGFGLFPGDTGTSIISIDRFGFPGVVSLAASGVPGGVTATFAPASTAGDVSTLTLVVSTTAPAGAATLTITGTGGGLTRTTTINLLVSELPPGDFALSASPAGFSIPAGGDATSAVTIDRIGFTGAVTFSVIGLPAGVTAAFTPGTTTGDTTSLTLSAAPDAVSSSTTITVVGTGGGELTRTVTLALAVTGG
jgi:hypothetical protein